MGMNKQWACIAMLVLGMALAAGQAEDFTEAKGLIDAKVPCAQLSDGQMEMIGDYYMEQMHPGEAHALMEQMMGGEGSAQVKQAHIAIAERIYCNERAGTGYGMGMMGWGMGPGMMDNWGDAQDADSIGNQRGGGMMTQLWDGDDGRLRRLLGAWRAVVRAAAGGIGAAGHLAVEAGARGPS